MHRVRFESHNNCVLKSNASRAIDTFTYMNRNKISVSYTRFEKKPISLYIPRSLNICFVFVILKYEQL